MYHGPSKQRVFDDGVAYRYRIPGDGERRVNGEATAGNCLQTALSGCRTTRLNYEGDYSRSTVEALQTQNGRDKKMDRLSGNSGAGRQSGDALSPRLAYTDTAG